MTEVAQFPDVEDAVLSLLERFAPTVTETAPDFTPPVIRVQRVGGSVDRLGVTDRARVEVACFGTTRGESRDMNRQVRALMLDSGASTAGGIYIDRVVEDTAPVQLPFEQPDTRRVVSTYVVSVRRQTPAPADTGRDAT